MVFFELIMKFTSSLLNKLVAFWRRLVGWLQKAYNKIKSVLGKAPVGTRTFLGNIGGVIKNISRNYVKEEATGQYSMVEYAKSADRSEIPAAILQKANALPVGGEIQTTDDLQTQLTRVA